MLRLLLPTTLALLLAPAVALAAPADAAAVGSEAGVASLSSGAPDHAGRSGRRKASDSKGDSKKESGGAKKGSGGASRDTSSRDSGSRESSSGDSGSREPSSREPSSRDSASRDAGSRTPTPAPAAPYGASRDGGTSRDSDRDGASREPVSRDAGGERVGASRDGASRDGASRDGEGVRTRDGGERSSARPAPYGNDSAGRVSPAGDARGAAGRSIAAARSGEGRGVSAETTRRVSAGMQTPSAGRALSADSPSTTRRPSAAPANFRGGDRLAVSGRGEGRDSASRDSGADRGDAGTRHGDGGADRGRDGRDGSAERHGGRGSDAERATHASGERHREAVRHARSTAAYHRSSAYYHRTAAARHHAWASARHARYGRWYAPGGWFRPYRPGHAYWYHGVFVYGPGPWHHHHDHHMAVDGGGGNGGGGDDVAEAPARKVDRARTFAVGIRGGSYMGGYNVGGGAFGDAGLGLAARYRPVEAVGLELSWMHHDQTWAEGSERVYQPLQASVQLFGMPWTKINPYVLAGVTVTGRDVEDSFGGNTVSENSTLWGPHAGVGLELGIGKKASINFDLRYTGYLNKPEGDLTVPGAAQGNMGLNFYF